MDTKIDIPAHVAFVNIKDGSVFFDCNPAEARLAKGFIEKVRKDRSNNIIYSDLKEIATLHKESALTSKARWRLAPFFTNTDTPEKLTVDRLNLMFNEMECLNLIVSSIVMNVSMYATFRGWGKAIFDEAPVGIIENVGVWGYIWSADVIVSRKVKPGRIILVSSIYRDVDDTSKRIKPKVIKFKL